MTITLNPALDLATSVDRVVAGPKLYCLPPRIDPGGGGVNVARAIRKLGGRATAFVVAGGSMGKQLLDLLDIEGVPTNHFHVPFETRHSLAVMDEETGGQYRFSLPGSALKPRDAEQLLSRIAEVAPQDGYVVLSGGVAPGLCDDFPQQIQKAIAPRTARLIVDTSKAPLEKLISDPVAPVSVLRVDRAECTKAAGHPMERIEDHIAFATALITRGVARYVVTGRGADGSVMVCEQGRYFCRSVPVPVLSAVGAGDAFVGALTLSLARGDAPDQALRWGVAAASATVSTEGTALCEADRTQALFETCELVQV